MPRPASQPPKPAGSIDLRYSAGYFTFAEIFSGWRNSPADAQALTAAQRPAPASAASTATTRPLASIGCWSLAERWLAATPHTARLPRRQMPAAGPQAEKRLAGLPPGDDADRARHRPDRQDRYPALLPAERPRPAITAERRRSAALHDRQARPSWQRHLRRPGPGAGAAAARRRSCPDPSPYRPRPRSRRSDSSAGP